MAIGEQYSQVYTTRFIGESAQTENLVLDTKGLLEIVFVLENGEKIGVFVKREDPNQLRIMAHDGGLILEPLGGVNIVGARVRSWRKGATE